MLHTNELDYTGKLCSFRNAENIKLYGIVLNHFKDEIGTVYKVFSEHYILYLDCAEHDIKFYHY